MLTLMRDVPFSQPPPLSPSCGVTPFSLQGSVFNPFESTYTHRFHYRRTKNNARVQYQVTTTTQPSFAKIMFLDLAKKSPALMKTILNSELKMGFGHVYSHPKTYHRRAREGVPVKEITGMI